MNRHPKFKNKKKAKPCFPVRQDAFYLKNNCAILEKIGKVKFQSNQDLPQTNKQKDKVANFYNPRVSFTNDKWILTFGMEVEQPTLELNDFAIGIDLGIKDLAIISCNDEKTVFKNINKTKRVKKLKRRLKHASREVSRKYKTNGNYEKTNRIIKCEKTVKSLYNKLLNIRKNYIHHVTTQIVKMLPSKIIMEDLNISGMMKNKHLYKAIQEQLWYEFTRQIEYKTKFYGIELIKVDRFYPSSKKCSCCGSIKQDLKLKDRTYHCDNCQATIDRDYNAARNLEKYGLAT